MIALLFILLAQNAAAPGIGAKATIVSRLSSVGCAALQREADALAPEAFTVVPAPEFPELRAMLDDPTRRVAMLYGIAIAELEELRGSSNVPPFRPLELEPLAPFDPPDREYAYLFADPVVLAIDRARVLSDMGRDVDTVLPAKPAALCGGKFEAMFFAAEVRLHSASGAFVGHLAFSERDSAESLLAGLGANLAGRTAPTDTAALERTLAEGAPAFALVTESAVSRLPSDSPLVPIRAFGNTVVVALGAAVRRGHPEADALLPGLLAPDCVARIARAEKVVPLRGEEDDLDPAAAIVARALADDAPRLAPETTRIREWVPRYGGELRHALGDKRQRFEDVYDVAILIVILLAAAWLLLKRRVADDPRR